MKKISTKNKTPNPFEISEYFKGFRNTLILCCGILLASLNVFAAATTTMVSGITTTSAVSGGTCSSTVTNDWITEVGIVWSTTTGPTVALATKTSTTYTYGTQYYPLTFNGQNMTGLTCGTTYYVRAYVRSGNGAGTVEYGNERSFTTTTCGPVAVTTTAASAVTATTATSGGTATLVSGAQTITERGIVYSTTASPTTATGTKVISGSGYGTYASNLTGLTGSTTYYVRAYAIASNGTTYYGSDITFTTLFQVSGIVSPYSLTPDWYFGIQGRYTFPSGSFPAVPPGPVISSNSANNQGIETSTSISFRSGGVAAYTNAMQSWNSAGTPLRNFVSDNTCAGSSTGGGVTFPDPARDTQNDAFYMIIGNDTTGGSCEKGSKGVYEYRVSGTSTLITTSSAKPAAPLENDYFATEAITAGTDGNGGYWVVVHDMAATNKFRVWRYRSTGRTGPVEYQPATTATLANTGTAGYLKFSPCMNMIAFAGFASNEITVYNFNRNTGAVGTQIARKAVSNETSGLEFSPDGTKVYYNGQGGVVKWFSVATPATGGTVTGSASWTIQMGPDAQIYTSGAGGTSVGVITTPNGAPGHSPITLTGGASTYRGLTNLTWLSPQKVKITAANTSGCNGYLFKYDFKNYFNDNVTAIRVEWDFNNDGTIDIVKTGASLADTVLHYFPKLNGAINYQTKVIVTDAYCNQLWKDSITVTPNCVLPVNFVRVAASKYDNDKVKVAWITAQEKNNDYFEIQRSADDQNYTTIGTVKGNGTTSSTQTYSYVDDNPINGASYYRILQVDINKGTMFSSVATVSLNKTTVLLAPNPFREDIIVSVDGIENKATVNVYDATGRLVFQNAIDAGASVTKFGAGLEKGTYIVEVIGLDVNVHQKVIKE